MRKAPAMCNSFTGALHGEEKESTAYVALRGMSNTHFFSL